MNTRRLPLFSIMVLTVACGTSDPAPVDDDSTETLAEESDTMSPMDGTSDSGNTTSTTTEGEPDCLSHLDCEGDRPLCEAGECVPCMLAITENCAVHKPTTPICNPATGMCAECTSTDTSACPSHLPVCAAETCVPCIEHAQCPDSACNLVTGACMPTDKVWWVDAMVEESGDGSEAAPVKTIAEILAQVPSNGEATFYLGSDYSQVESLEINGGRTIAILGKSYYATLDGFEGPALRMWDDAAVYAADLRLRSDGNDAIDCQGCTFIAQRAGSVETSVMPWPCCTGWCGSTARA
ncbi:MAG: hypothetical protein HC927_00545 [Deltaproteobacteria bacterium]|nr:hypothetical protein [Deltaproteobacteria bacterium]